MEYYSLSDYLKDNFHRKIYKVSIDGGFTCPNRDGRTDTRGCIFCSAGGSGEFAGDRRQSITEQINEGKKRVEAKMPLGEGERFIAYFQNFTGTYAPVSELRRKFTEAIEHPEVAILSIATRPDCLPGEVIELLSELNKIKPVWVELGLQTIHEDSARYIRRGYDISVYDDAMRRLKGNVSHIVVHVILGLPGEDLSMMKETVQYVADSGADGIKLQLLHVLKGTDLVKDYEAGLFDVMSLEEYVSTVRECVRLLPPGMVVHRLTGDGDKRLLIAPQWSADKKRVLNALRSCE